VRKARQQLTLVQKMNAVNLQIHLTFGMIPIIGIHRTCPKRSQQGAGILLVLSAFSTKFLKNI